MSCFPVFLVAVPHSCKQQRLTAAGIVLHEILWVNGLQLTDRAYETDSGHERSQPLVVTSSLPTLVLGHWYGEWFRVPNTQSGLSEKLEHFSHQPRIAVLY